ncbi:GlxA family transcriptional regulator [Streptomyces sp. NBC_00564]|uniref:GlxA family transcriptional regulator n=1 Tax=Streptomyces sp. NBC_00564 TaxID=2903663 RepID=UPI00352E4717|nr:helix-turn-helix domain-containing protein [Streptomyces sp. NBC_00564]
MRTHRVAVLALPGVFPLDLGIPTQIFNPRAMTHYELTVCGPSRDDVITSAGFTLGVTEALAPIAFADTIVVPGFDTYRQPVAPDVVEALRAASNRGSRVASICTGAFALAAADLLTGRTVTTNWASAGDLEELYPDVRVDRDVLYIDDDLVLTSAGGSAGIDLCLHIVRNDLGAAVANAIARDLVAAPHRDGTQSQFISRALPEEPSQSLNATRAWALHHLSEPLSLDDLARHAQVSTRTLIRMWRQETGSSPHQWLVTARLNNARELLEATDLSVGRIAARSGLGSGSSMRARFGDALGITPTEYRRGFRQSKVSYG